MRLKLFVFLPLFALCFVGIARAQSSAAPEGNAASSSAQVGVSTTNETEGHGGSHGAGEEEQEKTFDPHGGTWFNGITRMFTGEPAPQRHEEKGQVHYTLKSIRYDYLIVSLFAALALAATWVLGAKRVKIRPSGKASSLPNLLEAMLEGFQNYLISVMGRDMAVKYTPLIASFFFTILTFNYLGLIPGLVAPTTNPNIPIGMAIFAFFCVHIIAIKEAGVKSWFMHFVGEPIWLAPLNFPLHLIGEIIKPVSLSLRLLCNVFGEEAVVIQLSLLSLAAAASFNLPTFIPFQLPMLLLGTFFGFLQALVFSTLLAIYISIMATHHDDHEGHGHVEHVHSRGHDEVVGHPVESPVA